MTLGNNQVAAQKSPSVLLQGAWFLAHVAVVYVTVNTTTLWLSGVLHNTVLPVLQQHPPTVSGFQFAFSHLLPLSFFPALVIAFLISQKYRHVVASFVWIVPAAVLAYKCFTLPPPSIFSSRFELIFHQYFDSSFLIAEFHSYREMFEMAAANPDMIRGASQLRFTAPFYAGIGYAVGALVGRRWRIPQIEKLFTKPQATEVPI